MKEKRNTQPVNANEIDTSENFIEKETAYKNEDIDVTEIVEKEKENTLNCLKNNLEDSLNNEERSKQFKHQIKNEDNVSPLVTLENTEIIIEPSNHKKSLNEAIIYSQKNEVEECSLEPNVKEKKQRLIEETDIIIYKEMKEIVKLVKLNNLSFEEIRKREVRTTKEYFKFYLCRGKENEIKIISQSVKRPLQNDSKLSSEFFPYLLRQCLHSNENVRLYILLALGTMKLNATQLEEIEIILCEERSSKINNQLQLLKEKLNPSPILKQDDVIQIQPRVVFGTRINRVQEDGSSKLQKSQLKTNKLDGSNFSSINSVKQNLEQKRVEKVENDLVRYVERDSLHSFLNNPIQKECKRREIKSLYHITNARNLPSILKDGILSINELKIRKKDFFYNDELRLDNQLDSTCWSITHPNFYYFRKIQKDQPEAKWCIIEIEANVMWENHCYFNATNAASSKMRYQLENERKGIDAFNFMFNNRVNNYDRSENMKLSQPTDIQAEVLIFNSISIRKIKNVHIHPNDQNVYNYFTNKYPETSFQYNKNLFGNRLIYH